MPDFEGGFPLTLNHVVQVGRRSGTVETPMGFLAPSGETIVAAGMSVFIQQWTGRKVETAAGDFKRADYAMLFRYTEDVREGDLIYPVAGVTGLTVGQVVYVEPIMDLDGHTHHTEALIERVG